MSSDRERNPSKAEGTEHPLAIPHPLESLLQYQEGSVVSRTLLKKATGTLTLFAFDRGEELSEHSTPHDAVVEVLDGTGLITVGGREHRVGAGEALLLPARVPHAVKAGTPFKMLLVMIRDPG